VPTRSGFSRNGETARVWTMTVTESGRLNRNIYAPSTDDRGPLAVARIPADAPMLAFTRVPVCSRPKIAAVQGLYRLHLSRALFAPSPCRSSKPDF
jgi:hypothetical protein